MGLCMPESAEARWLLLIHQVPPKPNYFRVKVWRRLQRLGAVAIKNSVYVLPRTEQTYEDFEWVMREIIEAGGEASICEARFVEGDLGAGHRLPCLAGEAATGSHPCHALEGSDNHSHLLLPPLHDRRPARA